MYAIEQNGRDLRIVLAGSMPLEELGRWRADLARTLARSGGPFGLLVDMRDLSPPRAEAAALLSNGRAAARAVGMSRSAVIVSASHFATELRLQATRSGADAYERTIDASSTDDWEGEAWAWVREGKEPTWRDTP
jgi:hypothetical protein